MINAITPLMRSVGIIHCGNPESRSDNAEEQNTNTRNKTLQLSIFALYMAIICIVTMFTKIPLMRSVGIIHCGNPESRSDNAEPIPPTTNPFFPP